MTILIALVVGIILGAVGHYFYTCYERKGSEERQEKST